MKTIINITSYVGISNDAEHYYASIHQKDVDTNIYQLARNVSLCNSNEKLVRKLNKKEALYLNKKDGHKSYKEGDETERFDSVEDIIAISKEKFDGDIIFLINGECKSEEMYIVCRTSEKYINTGQRIKITNFTGFSSNFKNLINGSEHDVIKTPERYKNQKLSDGYWVNGVYEPALVLNHECILVK